MDIIFLSRAQYLRDREYLLHLLPKNGVVAEVGVADGVFSTAIYDIATPIRFHLIDTWEHLTPKEYCETDAVKFSSDEKQTKNYTRVARRFKKEIYNENVKMNKGFSATILGKFPDKYFDWVYIDANHDYEHVREDLEIVLPKIKEEGLICGHDYLEFNPLTKTKYGVIQAVGEFCLDHGWEIVNLTGEDMFKSYVLRRKGLKNRIVIVADKKLYLALYEICGNLIKKQPYILKENCNIEIISNDLSEEDVNPIRKIIPNFQLKRIEDSDYTPMQERSRTCFDSINLTYDRYDTTIEIF